MKHKTVAIAIIVTTILSVTTFAHPGNTDGNGGHYSRSSGEYHYHHGYPEHQHEDGMCPYKSDDNTVENDTSSADEYTKRYLEARAKRGLPPLSFEEQAVNLPIVTEQEDDPSLISTIGIWALNIIIALYFGFFFVFPIIGGIIQWIIETLRKLFARIFKK